MRSIVYGACALTALAAATAVTAPARAQSVGFITTQEGAISAPQSSPGGHYTLTPLGNGQYKVTFLGLGDGLHSNVQVTAQLGSYGPHYCTSAGWISVNGTAVDVYVDCFNAAGAPLNADFSVLYQARTTAPASGVINFMLANQPTAASYTPEANYSFNSLGGVNTVTRTNTGLYLAYMQGVVRRSGNPQVTAFGGAPARCEVADWYHNRTGMIVAVQCVNAAGAPADTSFNLSFTDGATQASGPNTTLGGYAWADKTSAWPAYTPPKAYNFNNLSIKPLIAVNSQNISFMTMRIPQGDLFESSLAMVTAYGSHGEYCDGDSLGYYGGGKRVDLSLAVACFNAQGQRIYSAFTADFMTLP